MTEGNDPSGNSAQAIAAQNIGLAHIIARRFHATLSELDYEDVASEATRALVKAAETFDLKKAKFTTYAATVIENRLCDVYDKQQRYRKIFEPALDSPRAEANDATYEPLQDLLPTPEVDPARQAHRNEMSRDITEMVKELEGKQKVVVEGIMNGESYQTIADRLGVSKQAVQQMAKRCFPSLKEKLETNFGSDVRFMPSTEPWEEAPNESRLPAATTSPQSHPSPNKKSLWMKIVSLFKST